MINLQYRGMPYRCDPWGGGQVHGAARVDRLAAVDEGSKTAVHTHVSAQPARVSRPLCRW